MTITPMDIQNKEFERSFRGYDIEDVDEFLDRVAKDLEQLIRENMELKDQLSQLQDKNKNYQKLEETMHNAIVVAQETAEEVKQNAKREADLIRREAEKEAQRIIEDARYRSSKILSEQEELFKQARVFKMRFRSFIEAQLSSLENEDWLMEADEDQARGQLKRDLEPRPAYEHSSGHEPSGYEPAGYEGPDFDSQEDFEADSDFASKPAYGQEDDFKNGFDFDDRPDYDPGPDFDPKPGFEPGSDYESTREFNKKKNFRPKRDYDFDTDSD